MTLFKPNSFLLSLRNRLTGRHVMDKDSTRGEPLKYRISGSHSLDVAYLSFVSVRGRVEVSLKFGEGASSEFVDDLTNEVVTVLNMGYGEGMEIKSYD